MKIFRITKPTYANDLSGSGAKLYGGRWNREGVPMIYTSSHISLAILEVLANTFNRKVLKSLVLVTLQIPGKDVALLETELPQTWNTHPYDSSTIEVGTEFIDSQKSLAISVPSAIVPQERNILINPLHSNLVKLEIESTLPVFVDEGLYQF